MNIEKGRLRIRAAKPEDAKLLCVWWNDGNVMAHAGYPNGLGISEEKVTELINADNDLKQRLVLELDHVPIGEMSYRTPEEKVAEIGIKICDPNQQNNGYGTESLKMLMKYIFENMKYEKIILDTNLRNERAQYVYEKLGFRKLRVNIDAWQDQLGELQSSVDYEISKDEYMNPSGLSTKRTIKR